jgi:uncharacterized membrane protein YhaH (DUF805 family)
MYVVNVIKSSFVRFMDFTGRAPRIEYWIWMFFVVVATYGIDGINQMLANSLAWGLLVVAFTVLPSVAIGVRRLHDFNASGWWILFWLIPVVGLISLIVIGCRKGNAGDNSFGPAPYDEQDRSRV